MVTRSMMGGWARRAVGVFGVALAPALLAEPVSAQAPAESEGVYQREIFDYPSLGRRNPFRGLNQGEQIGPRFDDLRLSGVLYNPAVGSVATLTDQKTGKRYRAREGDRLGEIRIAAIRPQEADFVITSFGISRRETLRVDRDKEIEG
jgi:hypothetical protein